MSHVSIAMFVVLATLAGCAGTATQPAPEPTTAAPAAPAAAPEPVEAAEEPESSPQASFVATPAVDPGFTHCCGDLHYKMEVDCGDRLKRCYVREGGEWKQTYGRHCKSQLGSACYLHLCDDACDAQ